MANARAAARVVAPSEDTAVTAYRVPPASSADPVSTARGAAAVASQAMLFSHSETISRPVVINGAAGMLSMPGGQLYAVFCPIVRGGRIVEINILADPDRIAQLDLSWLD